MNVKVEGQSRPRYLALMQPDFLWISEKKYRLPGGYAAIQKKNHDRM